MQNDLGWLEALEKMVTTEVEIKCKYLNIYTFTGQ